MEGVAAHAVADNLGQNVRAALLGEFQFFQNQDAGAFADDKAVAVAIEGTGGLLGLVVARARARAWPRIRRRPSA